MPQYRELAETSSAWPFREARRILDRIKKRKDPKAEVIFETGYGPSGLPHIGTFGEVARTTMVRKAFETLSDIPTRLICFSDDMDGLRKVPENIPNGETLREDLDLPLSRVRDPFGEAESFAAHNNQMLNNFLDRFGFEYEFISSTDHYGSGKFDETLLTVLERFDRIMEIMLPSLGSDRRETYSPFLPVSPKTGRVLQVPTLERNTSKGTIVYCEPDGEKVEIPVTGGCAKLQWKPDWGMRWAAFGVDYEMYGKDLIPSGELSTRICEALGVEPPVQMVYELFLDEVHSKISKSVGNGLGIEEWLAYAEPETLSLFMYQKPQTAKRLYFDVIPKTVDEYHQHLKAFQRQSDEERVNNPAWHVHGGTPPESTLAIPFSMLLNLAAVTSATSETQLWEFITHYAPGITPQTHPHMAQAAAKAVRYFHDRIAPERRFRRPEDHERKALEDLARRLQDWTGERSAEEIQSMVYAVGMEHGFDPLRNWFRALYEILLGTSQGPRFGGLVAIYGIDESVKLIESGLSGKLAA